MRSSSQTAAFSSRTMAGLARVACRRARRPQFRAARAGVMIQPLRRAARARSRLDRRCARASRISACVAQDGTSSALMRGQHPRQLRAPRALQPFAARALAIGLIEPVQQLIEQQQLRPARQRPRQQREPPLAVRQRQELARSRGARCRAAFSSASIWRQSASVSGSSGMSVRYRPVPTICATV